MKKYFNILKKITFALILLLSASLVSAKEYKCEVYYPYGEKVVEKSFHQATHYYKSYYVISTISKTYWTEIYPELSDSSIMHNISRVEYGSFTLYPSKYIKNKIVVKCY